MVVNPVGAAGCRGPGLAAPGRIPPQPLARGLTPTNLSVLQFPPLQKRGGNNSPYSEGRDEFEVS